MERIGLIEAAEKEYKQLLEEFFVSVYNEDSLPSHGIDHHRRVWSYAKEILELIPLDNPRFSVLPARLIVACYIHDIGMTVDQGEKHGKQSRIFCEMFLTRNSLSGSDWNDVLNAIENHDNKDYDTNSEESDLLAFLSVADDLDAFGFIGIFRYIEIYLTRRIDPKKMGYLIRENAENRFENFEETFGSFRTLVHKHRGRFTILDNFFSKYNEQVPFYHFGTNIPTGYCGVVELFLNMAVNKIEIKSFLKEKINFPDDQVLRWYFEGLRSELKLRS